MFSLIIPGRPCLTDMVTISANQSAFTFPSAPTFSHVVVFMLPGQVLPPDVAAAVYMQLPGEQSFRFLGAIANEKPSAIFKVNLSNNARVTGSISETVPDLRGDITIGISIESVAAVQNSLQQLQAQQQQQQQNDTGTLVKSQPSTKILAQRIIKNAFNFLSSFAGGQGGQEVVPLKSFQDWWKKFERRVENDPGFLERDEN